MCRCEAVLFAHATLVKHENMKTADKSIQRSGRVHGVGNSNEAPSSRRVSPSCVEVSWKYGVSQSW